MERPTTDTVLDYLILLGALSMTVTCPTCKEFADFDYINQDAARCNLCWAVHEVDHDIDCDGDSSYTFDDVGKQLTGPHVFFLGLI